jgi:hypothetical protein
MVATPELRLLVVNVDTDSYWHARARVRIHSLALRFAADVGVAKYAASCFVLSRSDGHRNANPVLQQRLAPFLQGSNCSTFGVAVGQLECCIQRTVDDVTSS